MKILHTADIHLREYGDDRWGTLETLIEIGKREGVEILVISGDLFDKDINAESLRPKIREIFSNTGFKIILIPGNHDIDSYRAGMYFGEDSVVLTELNRPFGYKDITIWGMPFEPISEEEVLNRLHSLAGRLSSDKKNILLYHGELLDLFYSRRDFGEEGNQRYMPVKLTYFRDLKIDYVLAGHFHSRFDVQSLDAGGYFVYPGSPVSITRRETGQRKVNIFEAGRPPREYLLDTPHFEEVIIELDPFKDTEPVEIVEERFKNLHPKAKAVLLVKGFFNAAKLGMDEKSFVQQIEKIVKERCADYHYEFKDIQIILEDELFKRFLEKLENSDYNDIQKKRIRDTVIKAMIESEI